MAVLVPGDWTVDRATKIIAYIGDDHGGASPSYVEGIEFHRWLQARAYEAVATGDDELDMTNTDPSRRSTDNIITLINGYTITNTESEHIFDGSIIQAGGNDIWDGITNFGNADVQIQIAQDGAVLSDDWWNEAGAGLNPDATAGISHRFMLPVRVGGNDIDNRHILGTSRTFGNTYSEFPINATARGNNVLALSDVDDINNNTVIGTVAGWTGVTNLTEGYIGLDVDNNAADEFYYSQWNTNQPTRTTNEFTERLKWLTRDGSGSTLYGLNGELFRGVTHQVAISGGAGTWVEPESLSWGSGATAGTGQLFAVDNTTASSSTMLWMQLLTGVVPAANTITGNGGATVTAGTVTARPVSTPFFGVTTGTNIIGAYGLGIDTADLGSADRVKDLTDTTIFPPNNVTNTIAGLVFSGNVDRVIVGPWDGTTVDVNGDPAIEKDELSLDVALTTDNITQVEITESIPSNTVDDGYIRVTDDSGLERRLHYQDWENGTPNRFFNIDTTDGNEDFAGTNASVANDIWRAFLDNDAVAATMSFTSIQSGSVDLVALVRNGGSLPIVQFIQSWTQTSQDQTLLAIRNSDL